MPNDWSNMAVIADDLTGTCDTACQFSRYGMNSVVTDTQLHQQHVTDTLKVNDTET